jgi:N-sulfoglucosamine sulfohydrolase
MPEEELYDMEADPWAMNNLVGSVKPEHQAALAKLRTALERWLDESDDQGRFPEPADVAARGGATRPGANFSTGKKGDAKGRRKSAADP